VHSLSIKRPCSPKPGISTRLMAFRRIMFTGRHRVLIRKLSSSANPQLRRSNVLIVRPSALTAAPRAAEWRNASPSIQPCWGKLTRTLPVQSTNRWARCHRTSALQVRRVARGGSALKGPAAVKHRPQPQRLLRKPTKRAPNSNRCSILRPWTVPSSFCPRRSSTHKS
jgi:hypothetical protein